MKYSSYLDSECLSILAVIQEDSLSQFFKTMRTIYKSVQFGRLQGFDELFVRFWKTIHLTRSIIQTYSPNMGKMKRVKQVKLSAGDNVLRRERGKL